MRSRGAKSNRNSRRLGLRAARGKVYTSPVVLSTFAARNHAPPAGNQRQARAFSCATRSFDLHRIRMASLPHFPPVSQLFRHRPAR